MNKQLFSLLTALSLFIGATAKEVPTQIKALTLINNSDDVKTIEIKYVRNVYYSSENETLAAIERVVHRTHKGKITLQPGQEGCLFLDAKTIALKEITVTDSHGKVTRKLSNETIELPLTITFNERGFTTSPVVIAARGKEKIHWTTRAAQAAVRAFE